MSTATAELGEEITFRSRTWVRPEDLNANDTLIGGSLPLSKETT